MSYCLFLSLIFHWVMLFLGPSFGGISGRQDWGGSQLPSHLLSHYLSLSAHLSLWLSLLPGVVVQQVHGELLMSQGLPAVILFTSCQLTRERDFIIYFSPSHCWTCNPFYAKGWTCLFPDSDRPPQFSNSSAVFPDSQLSSSDNFGAWGYVTYLWGAQTALPCYPRSCLEPSSFVL